MSRGVGAVCAAMPSSQNLVRGSNASTTPCTHAKVNNAVRLVHMAEHYIPCTSYNTPTSEGTRWLGTAGHRSEMQNAPPEPLMDAKRTRRISNSGVDAEVDTIRHPGEPSTREQDLKENGIYKTLRHRYAIHTLTRKVRISDNIQETDVWSAIRNDHRWTRDSRYAHHTKTPHHLLCARVEQLTPCPNIRPPTINMVRRHTRNRSHQRPTSSNPPSRHRQLRPLQKDRHTPTQNHGMRWRASNMELDTDKDSSSAPHGPLPHNGGLDNAADISLLASSETSCHYMDNSAPGGLQDATREEPLPPRLHWLSTTGQVESVPANTQATHNRQLPVHALRPPWAVSHSPKSRMEPSTHENDGRRKPPADAATVTGTSDLVSTAMREHSEHRTSIYQHTGTRANKSHCKTIIRKAQ